MSTKRQRAEKERIGRLLLAGVPLAEALNPKIAPRTGGKEKKAKPAELPAPAKKAKPAKPAKPPAPAKKAKPAKPAKPPAPAPRTGGKEKKAKPAKLPDPSKAVGIAAKKVTKQAKLPAPSKAVGIESKRVTKEAKPPAPKVRKVKTIATPKPVVRSKPKAMVSMDVFVDNNASNKPYCGASKVPKGKRLGTMKECAELGQVSYYGLVKIDPRTLAVAQTKKSAKPQSREDMIKQIAGFSGSINRFKGRYETTKDNTPEDKKKKQEYFKLWKKAEADKERVTKKLRKFLEDQKK